MTDIVLNHTSIDSTWIKEHPECSYNLKNSPHLVPAFLMDFIIRRASQVAAKGDLADRGIPHNFSASNMDSLRNYLFEEINKLRLYEFYQADKLLIIEDFKNWLSTNVNSLKQESNYGNDIKLQFIGTRAGKRFGASINFEHLAHVLATQDGLTPEKAVQLFSERISQMNNDITENVQQHISHAINCVCSGIWYRFFDNSGLKLEGVSETTPFVQSYFVYPSDELQTPEDAEKLASSDKAQYIMACNGWIMNADPMKNFAEPDSDAYIRREIIIWSDLIKLRYGNSREDCPFLWDHMIEYAKNTAKIFHSVRLDNCHSTPLHAAQAIADTCREVKPSIYIVAELFTGDEGRDNIFMNKIGINSLVREALAAIDSHDEGRMIWKYGALIPAGAFPLPLHKKYLYPSVAHALFYDATHDNPTSCQKRTPFDSVPSAALVSMGACGYGSTRGYDEFVPDIISVVNENRLYSTWPEEINKNIGLVATKTAINRLHTWLTANRYSEAFVDQVDPDILAISRFNPDTCDSVVLVAHTCFFDHDSHPKHHNFRQIYLNGRVQRLLFEARTINTEDNHPLDGFTKQTYINGLSSLRVDLTEDVSPDQSNMFKIVPIDEAGGIDIIEFYDFPPGSIAVVTVTLSDLQKQSIFNIRGAFLHQFQHRIRSTSTITSLISPTDVSPGEIGQSLPELLPPGTIKGIVGSLSLIDLNWILYRCEREENCAYLNRRPYHIPDFLELPFCGFQGIMSYLERVQKENDLGHPICAHLRKGLWLVDYLINRLTDGSAPSDACVELGNAMRTLYEPIKSIPHYLAPLAFATLTAFLYNMLLDELSHRLGKWASMCSSTFKCLIITTTQFYGLASSIRLPDILAGCFIPGVSSKIDSNKPLNLCSLSAGLPHFAEGMWRNWGRDTFIALRGCLLLTQRFMEAGMLILHFASLLRHGLIPNLMGDGYKVKPRYNSRDAVWFWLYAIICFETEIKNSTQMTSVSTSMSILQHPVWRWFPDDDTEGWPMEAEQVDVVANASSSRVQPLCDVMQEALQRHTDGISFVERNAGPELDQHMTEEGFKIEISIQEDTGFPSGGNKFNCGTWMDKMGSSINAGNCGIPATPRDGTAVELTALAYAVVSWLAEAYASTPGHNYYPHGGVKLSNGQILTWSAWASKIKENFEKSYWISPDSALPNPGAYKDLASTSVAGSDTQLRPNFLVSMVVSPDLFDPEHAWNALEIVQQKLCGPLGMRSLSPDDSDYRGHYHNTDDGNDFATAQGFNYHQGPEWLWLTGYYIRARLLFANLTLDKVTKDKRIDIAISEAQQILARCSDHIQSSPWRSLPELTNANGEHCPGSCGSQAWSVSCMVESVYDLLKLSPRTKATKVPSVSEPASLRIPPTAPQISGTSAKPHQTIVLSALIQSPDGTFPDTTGTISFSLWSDRLRVLCNVS